MARVWLITQDRPVHHAKSISTAQPVTFHQDPVEDHGKGQREHREKDFPVARQQKPKHHGQCNGCYDAHANEGQCIGDTKEASAETDRIPADTIEQPLTEGNQAGAHQHDHTHDDEGGSNGQC